MTGRTRVPAAVVPVLLAVGVAGCVSPATNDTQYRAKARMAVQAASGEVATTDLAVRQDLHRRSLPTYTDRVVTASETALGAISEEFGSVQPPGPDDDTVRDDIGDLITAAQDAVGHARIAVRRSDRPGLQAADTELAKVADQLDSAEGKL